MKLTILMIGCGDIGVTLGQELLDEGHRVIGVRRQAKALEHTGIEPLALDLSTLEGADASALPQADYVIYTVSLPVVTCWRCGLQDRCNCTTLDNFVRNAMVVARARRREQAAHA